MYVSIRMLLQVARNLSGEPLPQIKSPPCQLDSSIGKLIWTVPCARALMFSGATAGFLSGLLGVGGGFILVPALNKFTDLPMKSIVATSLGVLAIVSAGGAFISLASGTLNTAIAIPFACGSLLGLLLGKVLEKKISGPRIQQIFAVFTLIIAVSLMIKAINHWCHLLAVLKRPPASALNDLRGYKAIIKLNRGSLHPQKKKPLLLRALIFFNIENYLVTTSTTQVSRFHGGIVLKLFSGSVSSDLAVL